MSLSNVPVPIISDATANIENFDRRPTEDYGDQEREQLFVEAVNLLTRLRKQKRVETGLRRMVAVASLSPTATDDEVKALALFVWYWQERGRLGWEQAEPAMRTAERLDPDVRERYFYVQHALGWDENDDSPTVLDGIRNYWTFPEHYLGLLDQHESLDDRVQRVTAELSGARVAAAELSRQSLQLLTEAGELDSAIDKAREAGAPAQELALAQEQAHELREEAARLAASAQEYRGRAAHLLGTLNVIKPGYENPDGTPTARVVLPLELQRKVHDRDGGRCVKCGSTFKLQIDHVVPLSKGGSNEVSNLQMLCMRCNTSKGNRYVG